MADAIELISVDAPLFHKSVTIYAFGLFQPDAERDFRVCFLFNLPTDTLTFFNFALKFAHGFLSPLLTHPLHESQRSFNHAPILFLFFLRDGCQHADSIFGKKKKEKAIFYTAVFWTRLP